MNNGSFGSRGSLHAMVRRGNGLYEHHGLIGDLEKFEDGFTAPYRFVTALHAFHVNRQGAALLAAGAAQHEIPDALVKGRHHLGAGVVTNIADLALANDFNWASPSGAAINVLKLANVMATGTGTTAALATDIKLQTADSIAPVTATPSLVSAANSQILRLVGTLAYTGTEAVTEFGIFNSATLSTNTSIGSPFTAADATHATVTATPLTASSSTVQGKQQFVVSPDTTAVWGLALSNSTSQYTIPAWYKTSDGTLGSTPGATEAYHLLALMLDHKVFSALNVVIGDSVQYTYSLTLSGS